MNEFSDNCSDIVLLLTEYSRNQLKNNEKNHVNEHLKRCNYCSNELSSIKKLSIYTDKLIPYLGQNFHNKLIYSVFIKEEQENFVNKIIALLIIILIITFSFINEDYKIISLNDIQIRINEMFLDDSIINKKNVNY